MKRGSVILIETRDAAESAEWGVSVDGPNPTAENYVGCANRQDAEKCIAWLQALKSDLAAAREELAEALPDAQRFRALIRMSEEWPSEWHVGHHKGHPPGAHVVHLTVLGDYFTGATFVEAFDTAIAALDQEVGDGE